MCSPRLSCIINLTKDRPGLITFRSGYDCWRLKCLEEGGEDAGKEEKEEEEEAVGGSSLWGEPEA